MQLEEKLAQLKGESRDQLKGETRELDSGSSIDIDTRKQENQQRDAIVDFKDFRKIINKQEIEQRD